MRRGRTIIKARADWKRAIREIECVRAAVKKTVGKRLIIKDSGEVARVNGRFDPIAANRNLRCI